MLRFLLPDRCLRIADLHKKPEYKVKVHFTADGTLYVPITTSLIPPRKVHDMIERERAKRAKYPRC